MNYVLGYFGKRQSVVKLQFTVDENMLYCTYLLLCYGTWVILRLVPSVLHGERVYGWFGVFHTVYIAAYCIL